MHKSAPCDAATSRFSVAMEDGRSLHFAGSLVARAITGAITGEGGGAARRGRSRQEISIYRRDDADYIASVRIRTPDGREIGAAAEVFPTLDELPSWLEGVDPAQWFAQRPATAGHVQATPPAATPPAAEPLPPESYPTEPHPTELHPTELHPTELHPITPPQGPRAETILAAAACRLRLDEAVRGYRALLGGLLYSMAVSGEPVRQTLRHRLTRQTGE